MIKTIIEYVEQLASAMGFADSSLLAASHVMLTCGVALAGMVMYLVCHRFVMPLMVAVAKKTSVGWDDILLNENTLRAACRVVPAVVVWMLLPKVFYHYADIAELLRRATVVYIAVMSMHLGLAFIDSFKKFEGDHRTAMQQYFHTFCGVLKIVVIFVALIVIASIVINRSPLTLLAGLGATSAILMLVFKDTITGLVAGIRLTSNDMLHKGDWITVPKAGANGLVEDMTLTTVKVRNFDNTIVTVAPQTLVDDSFQNWIGMRNGGGRRVMRKIFFDFRYIRPADEGTRERLARKYGMKPEEMLDGAVNMTLFRRYVERWLVSRDDVNGEMMFFVRQLEPTSTGLPMEIYFFLKQKEWKPYEHHLAEIMENIYAMVPDFGLRIYQRV